MLREIRALREDPLTDKHCPSTHGGANADCPHGTHDGANNFLHIDPLEAA
jgi:hypothetical protein